MSFAKRIDFFLTACPGPPLARHALSIAALQPVRGIAELGPENGNEYLASTTQVAKRAKCRPEYLYRAASTHGYSFAQALRWIRFLHAMALLAEGCRVETLANRLGFSDIAGWSRFTKRLVGRSRSQLPVVPLDYWVRKAVDDVFFGVPACAAANGGDERGKNDNEEG